LDAESDQAPDPASSGDPAVVAGYLRERGEPYLLLDELRDDRARLRFTGPFEGENVVWDCELVALQNRERCFIEIGEPVERGVPLRVGLNLARIDHPAILKMMVMIRNYRRLRRGRHEFSGARP
jgi:hypothetical protein